MTNGERITINLGNMKLVLQITFPGTAKTDDNPMRKVATKTK